MTDATIIVGKKIIGCYQDVRDHVVFTNKRVIILNLIDPIRIITNHINLIATWFF